MLLAAVAVSAVGSGIPAAGASSKPSATKEFCDAFRRNSILGQKLFVADPGGTAATALTSEINEGVTAAKAVVPSAIADEYDVITADPPDLTALDAAQKAIDTWVLAHCKFEVVKVTADDASVKMPKTLRRGFVAFDMTNTGTTGRYYGVLPLPAGRTVAQLVATPLDQLRPLLITEARTLPGQEAVAYGLISKPGVHVVIDGDSVGTPQPSYTTFTVKK